MEPRTRSQTSASADPFGGRPEAVDGELLADGRLPADRDPSRSLTASWRRFAFAVQPYTRIALLRQGGVRASSRPHDSPQTGQTTHLPKDPAAQPGAERADVIASEPV